jgi:alpha-beta hydrolase superfamily lysophospholipase
LISGAEKVELKLYEGARHELFNETNADEYFGDLLKWLEARE